MNEYRQAITENKLKLHSTELKHCKIIDDILFRKDLLWISENMHTKLLKKIHDQSFIFHSDNWRIINLVQRFCYEHVWIDQSSDDAMPSLNLAHLYWTLRVILSTSSRCSALSSFISFIILLDKHIWHITSHLYRV